MIYILQLIYIKDDGKATFQQFEDMAISLISKYGGQLILRIDPNSGILSHTIEIPDELHLLTFPTEKAFEDFMRDETRNKFLHLKKSAIRTTLLIKGSAIE